MLIKITGFIIAEALLVLGYIFIKPKKSDLFKNLVFALLQIVILTWVLSASYFTAGELSNLGMYRIGFFDFFQLLFGSFQFAYFIQIMMLLVSIGALYGVLGKTGKYRAIIERIASKLKGKENVFLIGCAFVISAITSAFDYGFSTFIFIPFLISIILTMKYDKITAFVTTFGAYFVGIIGSTVNESIISTVNGQLTNMTLTSGIYFKLILYVLSFAILVFFLLKSKKSKTKDESTEDMFIGDKVSNKYSALPIIIVFSIIFVILVLGCTGWETVFGVTAFSKFNTWLASASVLGDTYPKFIIGTISAFGEWYYAEMAVICLIAALLLGKLYRIKFADILAAMAEGARKMIPSALLVGLAYTVVYFSGNTMFFPTIADAILGLSEKFNLFLTSLATILGSAFHVDMLYISNYVIAQIAYTTTNHTLVALMIQSLYGLTMIAVPTSAMLVLGLNYLDISYKEWIKSSWKLILELLIAIFIILLVFMLI